MKGIQQFLGVFAHDQVFFPALVLWTPIGSQYQGGDKENSFYTIASFPDTGLLNAIKPFSFPFDSKYARSRNQCQVI